MKLRWHNINGRQVANGTKYMFVIQPIGESGSIEVGQYNPLGAHVRSWDTTSLEVAKARAQTWENT